MKLQGKGSKNVEDRRGVGARAGLPIGCGTLVVIGLFLVLGGDPAVVLGLLSEQGGGPAAQPRSANEDQLASHVSRVLADTETTWNRLFSEGGSRYQEPKLVLFTDRVQSACGFQSAAVGPFYCPADRMIYIDLGFYGELSRRFGAPGDFAQAYVLAHEVGHHIQNLLGTSQKVHAQRSRLPQAAANELSVRQELQADCYAGVWAHHAHKQRNILEVGDLEEGLTAAAAIGDDRIQLQAQGHVVPESWTHGSGDQRVRWFGVGLQFGDMKQCDTFSASQL